MEKLDGKKKSGEEQEMMGCCVNAPLELSLASSPAG